MTDNEFSDQLTDFIETYYWDDLLELANEYPEKRSLLVNFTDIGKFSSKLAREFIEAPNMMLSYADEALAEISLPVPIELKYAHFRIHNVLPKLSFREIRSAHIGRLISIEGMIRKSTDTRPRMTKAAFYCLRCGHTTYVEETNSKFEEPFAGCEQESCGKKGPFQLRIEDSTFIDSQKLQIEEPPENLRGMQAQSLEVYAEDDLAGLIWPGERVIITGILKTIQRTLKEGKSTYFDILLEAVSITKLGSAYDEIEISQDDELEITSNASDPLIYDKLTNSIAPAIYGMEDVKEAMVLQQFGGVTKRTDGGSNLRGDIHLLLMGDPSKAKSKLMEASYEKAPTAIFVSGESASGGGLTAIVTKDDKWGDGKWTVEAGAMVSANKGILFLDEGDKLKPEAMKSLHQAMELMKINLAKAGIIATLPANTSICMAANPKYGQFDKYEPLADQIALMPSLLSRFDLIYVLLDTPDPQEDARISEHLLNSHHAAGILKQKELSGITTAQARQNASSQAAAEISPEMIKKHIAYARKNVAPVLTEESKDHIHNFYLGMRKAGASSKNSTPIAARQEEACIRLAEASAKVQLSNIIRLEDAKRATRLIQACLNAIGVDPQSGETDASLWNAGVSKSQRDAMKALKELLQGRSALYPEGKVPIMDLVNAAELQGIKKERVETYIKKMAERGDVLRWGMDHVKLVA